MRVVHLKKLTTKVLAFTLLLLPSTFISAADSEELTKFLGAFQPQDKQAISNIIDQYRNAKLIETPKDESRQSFGKIDSPMSMLEWIDIQCPHCKNLNSAVHELQQMTPPGSWRVEARHFPLDNECNPHIPQARKPGVSCLAAKVLICLHDKPNMATIRNELFNQQRFLTKDIIWNTATSNKEELESLKTCVESEATKAKLSADIELAEAHGITGTPMVVVNGRKAAAVPPIIYALVLAEGNANAEPFKALPAPQEMKAQPGHEGHDH